MKRIGIILLCVCLLMVSACGGEKKVESGKLQSVYDAVKSAYGENYLPNMMQEKIYLTEVMGIKEEDIKEFIAELPMISMHVDMFVGVEAASGKGEDVEKAMQQYLEMQLENALMYPMNVPKMKTARVVRVDDYVFFICLGAYIDDMDADDTTVEKYYQEQVDIAEKAIHDTLGK